MPEADAQAIHIICFHGGGGVAGNPKIIEPFCNLLREGTNITTSLARYRTLEVAPAATLEEMLEDACKEVVQARNIARHEGAQLYVMGASFGALLALHAVMENPDGVRGLVLLNPVVDIGQGGFFNRVVKPEYHAALSPNTRYAGHALLSQIRCFIAHGTDDEVLPLAASHHFAALWPKGRCELIEYPGATHGFFNRPPRNTDVAKRVADFVMQRNTGTMPTQPHKRQLPPQATLLFGIGALRSETGWLHDYLSTHPECHTTNAKEVHYFNVLDDNRDAAYTKNRIASLRQIANDLDDKCGLDNLGKLRQMARIARHLEIYTAQPDDHNRYIDYLLDGYRQQKILCDITPTYYTLPASAFAKMDNLGQAKYIFLMPDPVERMWSQIQIAQGILTGNVRATKSAEILARCEEQARKLCRGGLMGYSATADYAQAVHSLESVVPRSRILYHFRHPSTDQQAQDELCEFLGIRPHSAQLHAAKMPAHPNLPLPAKTEAMMLEALRPQYDFALNHFGAPPLQGWRMPQALKSRGSRPLNPAKNPTIAFLHIPKTAGQTVVSEIRRVVGAAETSPVRTHTEVAEDAQLPLGYRFYGGHLDWVDLETLPENRFSFTILRAPRERIASFYFYLLREAQALSEKELLTQQRTGMRMILRHSAEDYFFGGDQAWQGFIHDHYDNFYCNYLATRRIRGWKGIRHLSEDKLVERALKGAQVLDGVYSVDNLEQLEKDLSKILGSPLKLVGNYKNAGPKAQTANRWETLIEKFKNPENIAKLEKFVHTDEILMKHLNVGNSL